MKPDRVFTSSLALSLLLAYCNLPAPGANLGGFVPGLIPRFGALMMTGSTNAPQAKYERQYEQIWVLVQNNFLYRNRLHNWSRWRHRYDGQLTSAQAMQVAVDRMLSSLNDPYTYYRDASATSLRNQEDLETNVVDYRIVGKNVGYIRLKTFSSKSCVDEMRNGMQQLKGARAIVVDLRDNKGGSVDDAFRIFSMFVKSGQFTSMTGIDKKAVVKERLTVSKTKLLDRRGASTKTQSRERNLSKARPLFILVDGRTKSAAEMLAGALRDSAGAKLIGTQTYGKGVIQRVWEFDNNTSVKVTAAAYKLPCGATIHGVGIKPAIKVLPGKSDKQLQLATRLLWGDRKHPTASNRQSQNRQ
ncbi:hypothetical protein BH10CYA1_BH10CYA1_41660 [soil metagenome]